MKQKLTKLLCSVFLVAFAIPAIAQSSGGSSTRTITGKVTDSEGAPIIGAVVMASQREATTTNSEGRYTLAVQSPDAVLRFSCMGYRPRSENTAGRTVVDVSLETDNQLLEDVVVVGYGCSDNARNTGWPTSREPSTPCTRPPRASIPAPSTPGAVPPWPPRSPRTPTTSSE